MKIYKEMRNLDIARLLESVAAAYQIKNPDKNRFKIIAYERAAVAVEHSSSEVKDLWDEDKLDELPGIGKSIAAHLGDIFKNGKSSHFEKVMEGIPPQVFDLLEISGVGPKTAVKLVKDLNLSKKDPVGELLKYAEEGKIETLEGFGKDSQDEIIRSIKELKGRSKRLLLNYAEDISESIIDWMKKSKAVVEVSALGSLRRKASTVGDIDIGVSSNSPQEIIKHFTRYPNLSRILEKGELDASIILPGDIQVDVKIQPVNSFGALLQHFTGSKQHNIALREYARSLSLSLSEYGVKNLKTKKIKKFRKEEFFYEALGMEWIPPELREDSGEIKFALMKKLPTLVKLSDIKGDLQIHSDFDIETSHDLGESSMEVIVTKADDLGYEYIAFTEHNPSHSRHSEKQIVDILKRKQEAVEKLNQTLNKRLKSLNTQRSQRKALKRVFNSLEIDILPSGKLPVSEKGLETLDFALISIHSSFRMDKNKMTKRILSAFSHPKVKIFAHPTARIINKREGIEADWEKILEFCESENKWLEINADPMRLDLPDFLVKEAVEKGVKMTLGTDSHHKDHLDNMKYATYVARRGWCKKENILNSLSLVEFEKLLRD